MPIIDLDHVSYTYPMSETKALRDVTLRIHEGEFVAVIGPNGAGKSTLCHSLAGFVPHFFKGTLDGSLQVAGLSPNTAGLEQMVLNAGLMFQNPSNQISGTKYTVFEEIAFGLENIGVPRHEMIRRVEQVMDMAGIAPLAQRNPYELSGGQQQRVALASILVMEPRILILDEPTAQLDPVGSREIFEMVHAMSGRGMTVVLVEHKIEWIAQFASRVVVMHEGSILLDGSPGEILASPRLAEIGVAASRFSTLALEARRRGIYPHAKIPVTLEEAVQGFSR